LRRQHATTFSSTSETFGRVARSGSKPPVMICTKMGELLLSWNGGLPAMSS
jgi:hypothetical protein